MVHGRLKVNNEVHTFQFLSFSYIDLDYWKKRGEKKKKKARLHKRCIINKNRISNVSGLLWQRECIKAVFF